MKRLTIVVLMILLSGGFSRAGMANDSCGCLAACDEGWSFKSATKCYTESGACKSDSKEDKCSITCVKEKMTRVKDGKCVRVYTAEPRK